MRLEEVDWNNRESVMQFIRGAENLEEVVNHDVLGKVAPELRDDEEIVKMAIEYQDWGAMELLRASERLQKDKSMILFAVEHDWGGDLIDYLDEASRNDKEIVLAYAKISPSLAAQCIGEKLEIDDDIQSVFVNGATDRKKRAIEAICRDKLANYLNDRKHLTYPDFTMSGSIDSRYLDLCTSKDFIIEGKEHTFKVRVPVDLEYRRNDSNSDISELGDILIDRVQDLENASDEVKNNPLKMKFMIAWNGLALKYASEEIRNNPDFVKIAVEQNGLALEFASQELRDNKDIVSRAVKRNGLAIEFAGQEAKNDWNIAEIAIRNDINAFKFVGENLRNNPKFLSILSEIPHRFHANKRFESFREAIENTMGASYSLDNSDLYEFVVDDMDKLYSLIEDYNSQTKINPPYVYVDYDDKGNRVFGYSTSTGVNAIYVTEIVEDGKIVGYNADYVVSSTSPIEYSSSMKSFKEKGWDCDEKAYYDSKVVVPNGEYLEPMYFEEKAVNPEIMTIIKKHYEQGMIINRSTRNRRIKVGTEKNATEIGEDLAEISRAGLADKALEQLVAEQEDSKDMQNPDGQQQ